MSDMNDRLIEALEEAEALAAENAKLREEVERLKADAPEEATHISEGAYLLETDKGYMYWCPEYEMWDYCYLSDFNNVRSLNDLREIQRLRAENESLWLTYLNLADLLGVDASEARKQPGKPSDVFFKHFEALRAENEALRNACKMALHSHGVVLPSHPPKSAWDYHNVSDVLRAALRQSAKEE